MRVSRLLNNEPLDEIAQAVKVSKSRISTLERFPHGTISPSLKKRIEKHYGLSFDLLACSIDSAAVLALLKQQVVENVYRLEESLSAV
jgi:transcriptional regulator with XRE-family HTH domain